MDAEREARADKAAKQKAEQAAAEAERQVKLNAEKEAAKAENKAKLKAEQEAKVAKAKAKNKRWRVWHLNGKDVGAALQSPGPDSIIFLKPDDGPVIRVPFSSLSAEEQDWITHRGWEK